MKLRWLIVIVIVVLVVLCTFLWWPSNNSKEKKALEETRRALRQQGFKTDLGEFNFFTSEELRARETALISLGHGFGFLTAANELISMSAAASDAAIVVWKQEQLETGEGKALWATLREAFNENRATLDDACEAVLSGPIRFNLDASRGGRILLPHLAMLKNLSQSLGGRAILELHDENKTAAWKNLLASTRLATAWEPDSIEMSHLVRAACATIAFNTTWQLLQEKSWTDNQLAGLQREWETVDFLSHLPETAAFSRASAVEMCRLERQQPLSPGAPLRTAFQFPQSAWQSLNNYWRERRYRNIGTYEDEKALLLHYRDRELELRRAVEAPNWSRMRQLPGITNAVPFQSKHSSRVQTIFNLRQISMNFVRQGGGLPDRAAEAEARRRVIVTAIALERYRGRHGSYPKTILELTPEFLKNPPIDFMDGNPLRYRLTSDENFVLYSVGLDCVDNSGKIKRQPSPSEIPRGFGVPSESDLVWPRPASAAEVDNLNQQQTKALSERINRAEETWAIEQWRRTAKRQAEVKKFLAENSDVHSPEPIYRGRRVSEIFRNPDISGTDNLTLRELLTLRQVITGDDPETVTFEVPIAYDVLTNLGSLFLLIDPSSDEDSDEGCNVGQLEIQRHSNGNCLLVWQTIYESPGQHALQMALALNEPAKFDEAFYGPLAPFVVSNLCQFSLSSAYFNPKIGATLYAKLPEANGSYTLDIIAPAGNRVKTMTGNTTNSVIKVHWDLIDEHGNKCTNDFFNTVVHITLPDSGRSQTLRGP